MPCIIHYTTLHACMYTIPYMHLQHSKMYTPHRWPFWTNSLCYAVCCTDEPFFILFYFFSVRSFVRSLAVIALLLHSTLVYGQSMRYSSAAVYFHIATVCVERCKGSPMYRSFSSAHSFSFLMFGCIKYFIFRFLYALFHERKKERKKMLSVLKTYNSNNKHTVKKTTRKMRYTVIFEQFFLK